MMTDYEIFCLGLAFGILLTTAALLVWWLYDNSED